MIHLSEGGTSPGRRAQPSARSRSRSRLGWSLLVLLAGIGGAGGLTGCSDTNRPVLIVGRDDAGTLVVGTTRCSARTYPASDVRLVRPRAEGREVLWAATAETSAPTAPPASPSPGPPAPSPAVVAEAQMVSIGSEEGGGWTTVTPLVADIGTAALEVEATDRYERGLQSEPVVVALPVDPTPDRYVAGVFERQTEAASSADLLAEIRAECDPYRWLTWRFVAVAAIASGVVLVAGVGVGVLIARQYRRAGRGVAARRAGPGLPGAGGVP